MSFQAIEKFRQAIESAGLTPPGEIIPDGQLHRFSSGDDGKNRNSWYVYYDDPEFPAGAYGCWKRQIDEKWCGKVTKTLTKEEKQAFAKRMEEARQKREAEAAKIAAECRAWCARVWESSQEAPATHPYLQRKQIHGHGARLLMTGDDDGALMIPVKDSAGVIHGIQFIHPDGSKKFKTGTVKAGNCYRIGQLEGVDGTLVITEGFATGSSIYQATGYCVLVAFDAGNLLPLAELVRGKLPAAKIIIAADNDAWLKLADATTGEIGYKRVPCNHPITGKRCVNTGVVKATEAAKACSALLAVPTFPDDSTHPTDFNDLHALHGLDEVGRQFDLVTNPPLEPETPEEKPPPLEEEEYQERDDLGFDPSEHDKGRPFTCLGYDHNIYYYLPQGSNQVIPLRAEQHGKSHLITLAPLNYWEDCYPSRNGANFDAAANALIRFQERKGVYDPSRLRGRGAWEDAGRSVLHLGNVMYVDGVQCLPYGIVSNYIYESAPSMEHDLPCKPLLAAEAKRFVDICDLLTWERPIYGRLLAGWCVIAPVCGAMRWRPHVHLTGAAGTGKSWTVKNIVARVVGPAALQVVGSTTAAAIRQSLNSDARPVIHDEFEAEDQLGLKRNQEELELARACSSDSEALTLKGGADGRAKVYRTRAAFCFASIGVNMSQQADVSRVTVLSLRKDENATETERQAHFDKILEMWAETMTEEFCCALRARTVRLIPVIRKNADTFARAAAIGVGTQRTGDQLGALLAGAYACYSSAEISLDEAKRWIASQDWSEYTVREEQLDERRCLSKILQTVIKAQGDKGAFYEVSIGELIHIANMGLQAHSGISDHAAEAVLKRHGIKVSPFEGVACIANNHVSLETILEKTPWAKNWGQLLARLPGAQKTGPVRFGPGSVSKSVQLPLDSLT